MNHYKFKVKKAYDRVKYFLLDLGFSYNLIKSLSKSLGQIKRNNISIRMNDKVSKGDLIEIFYSEQEINNIIPTKGNLEIAYEDNYVLIVYKNHNTATIPSYCNNENSLANFVTYYMQQKDKNFIYRAVNRLDKTTSGYIIICKDLVIYNLLLKHKLIKKYEVITTGKLHKQTINLSIKTTKNTDNKNNIKRIIDDSGKVAITKILCSRYNRKQNISYGTIKIFTGRTHQIRLHLSSINNSILGDELYGTKKAERMYLNCYYIKFYHPILGKNITLKNQILLKEFKCLRNQI